jgi:hypothetical protein
MSKINSRVLTYLENDPTAVWAVSNLLGAYNNGFYGRVTIQFEAGKIVLLRKDQTQKPPRTITPNGKGSDTNGK